MGGVVILFFRAGKFFLVAENRKVYIAVMTIKL